MWPSDESTEGRLADLDKKMAALKTAKDRSERAREGAFRAWKESGDVASNAEKTLEQLREHMRQVEAKAEAARDAQRQAFDAFTKARNTEAEARLEFMRFVESTRGVIKAPDAK